MLYVILLIFLKGILCINSKDQALVEIALFDSEYDRKGTVARYDEELTGIFSPIGHISSAEGAIHQVGNHINLKY